MFRISSRVSAGESATGLDIGLEGRLLRGIQHVARGVQEDHGFVLSEIRLSEERCVLCVRHREIIRRPKCLNCRQPLVDRIVPETGRLRKHQHVERSQHLSRL